MEFSNEEKVDMIFIYAKCNRNAIAAATKYLELYPERRQPNRRYFQILERSLRANGSFEMKKNRVNTITTEGGDQEGNVLGYVSYKNIVQEDVSLREVAVETGISKTSVRKILKRHRYRPYKVQKIHHLRNTDFYKRRRFCRWLLQQRRQDENICQKILWSDESRFTNNGWFNRNCHYRWTQENQHLRRETHFQERFGINVWIGVLDTKILGPYFFGDTLTAEVYLNFLTNALEDLLDELPLNVRNKFVYYQHDGAPAHRQRQCVAYLNNYLPGRWIGNNGPILWPPRSPDLTILDYFVWGYIKDLVYLTSTRDVEHLKDKIRAACNKITTTMLRKCHKKTISIARRCIFNNGDHVE